MSEPYGFSWVDKPHLAALARPDSVEELHWLREQGIEVLLSLTEEPPRRDWINDTGLLLFHVPIEDMEAPTAEQLDLCMSAIQKANERGLGVAVHCGAGLGRTGVILAAYYVAKGDDARSAMGRVRRLRPGSIETAEQEGAIRAYARRLGQLG